MVSDDQPMIKVEFLVPASVMSDEMVRDVLYDKIGAFNLYALKIKKTTVKQEMQAWRK